MAGKNPYISAPDIELPTQKYTITFMPGNLTFEVDPDEIPYGPTGQPGSILDIGLTAGADIEHTCGGVCACSTCHVIVRQGMDTCNEATDDELDQLEEAPGLEMNSRLACQTVPNGTRNIVVEIPSWNRNAVKESH